MKDWMTKRKIIALGAVIVCCFALIAGIGSMMQKEEAPAQSEPLEIQAKEEQTQTEIQTTPSQTIDWDAVIAKKEGGEVLEEYKEKKQEIPDMVGWLKIEGTGIDYPVVQRDNEYYMDHDDYGNEDVYGAVFLEQVNDYRTPDNNLMIYGHNRKDEKMFGELMNYKSEEYYKEHPFIQFDTLYEKGTYEIISVFLSKVYYTTDTNFKYYQFFGSEDPEKFESYVENVKKLSLYPIDAGASAGDFLITLSTCEYSTENGRLAVVARKLPEGEE